MRWSVKACLVAEGAERLRECITPEGFLRLLPGQFGTDGFFVALIEKRARADSDYEFIPAAVCSSVVISAKQRAQRFDHQFVIALVAAGRRRSRSPRPPRRQRAAETSRRGWRSRRRAGPGSAPCVSPLIFSFMPDGVRTAIEARDDVALAAHPFDVVGRCAVHGGIKERLAESADVDHHGELALVGRCR